MKKITMAISILLFTVTAGVFMTGCGSSGSDRDDDKAPELKFRVTIANLTANQPFSPVGVVLHGNGYTPWALGQAASVELEALAEGGSPDPFIAAADADQDVIDTVAGTAPIGMGVTGMFEVTAGRSSDIYLSIATMLVNTNDAFVGINSEKIEDLAVGDSRTLFAVAMDAGTEMNSEALADIPGPAANGEGFNAARNDQDLITGHPGVVTADDGLLVSALDESHRWDNPVAKITVMRLQ